MLSKKRLYVHLLQSIISVEASISTPGIYRWFRVLCLKTMGIKVNGSVVTKSYLVDI